MRRRTLLGGDGTDYVFSASTTSVSASYTSSAAYVNITSTASGTNIGYSVVSYDGTVVTGVTTAATYVYIYYSSNSTYYERNGNVVLKQNASNKTITINVSQAAKPLDLGYGGILFDGTSGSYGSISFATSVTFSNIPDWADVTYSSGKINVTATSTNSASTARLATMTVSYESSSASLTIIQLPSDYHSRDYVSIEGINWAIKNVGASSVQDYGNYFKYGYGSQQYESSYDYYEGMENPLASTADTATQVMGSGWRMPTYLELNNKLLPFIRCIVSYNGVNGCVFELNGNVLFFPAGGYYLSGALYNTGEFGLIWSSTPIDSRCAYSVIFGQNIYNMISMTDSYGRFYGLSVRGVQA